MVRLTLTAVALFGTFAARAADPELVRVGSDRFRQPGQVKAIAYSQDGKQLATAGEGYVYLWDAADGRRVQTVACRGFVSDLGFVNGGRTLLAAADHQEAESTDLVRIDVATGKAERGRVLDARVSASQFSPDGRWLLLLPAETRRGYVVVDTTTGKVAWDQPDPGEAGRTAHAIRADSRVLAVGETHGRVRLRELAGGKVLHDYRLSKGTAVAMAFSPDGSDLVVKTVDLKGNRLTRIRADTGEERWAHPTKEWADPVAFAADGSAVRYLKVGPPDSEGFVWQWLDARTGKPLDRTLRTEQASALALRADGKVLAQGGYAGLISQWDLETGRRIAGASAEPPEEVTELRFSPDGSKLRGFARGWYEWDLKVGTQTRLTPDIDRWTTRDLAVSDDQRWLARYEQVRSLPGRVELIESPAGRPRPTGLPIAQYYDLRFAADGRLLATEATAVHVVDPAAGRQIAEVPWEHGRRPFAFAGDGKLAVTVDPTLDRLRGTRWDLTTGKAVGSWDAVYQNPLHSETGVVWAGHLSPDGGWLGLTFFLGFLGDPEGHAILLDARTGRVAAQWKSQEPHNHWAFAADSRSFIVFPSRAGVELRETATGGVRRTAFAGNNQLQWSLRAAAFRPDGGAIALAQSPGPVSLWNLVGLPTGTWKDENADGLWAALGGDDAGKAFDAIRQLRQHPAEAVALLKARVKVPAAPTREWVTERIKLLDAARFRDREKATTDLAGAGELIATDLRAALKGASPEALKRLEGLLEKVDALTPDKLRAIRACEVLEGIGTADARELLAAWAKGPAAATLSREASGSVERVGRRGSPRGR